MTTVVLHECDQCSARAEVTERSGFGYAKPAGWHRVDGKEVCSWECVKALSLLEIEKERPAS